MRDSRDAALAGTLTSLAADALALGAHWIYDSGRIAREIAPVNRLLAPPPDSYHKRRAAGDFTHYGDQTFVLLESVAASGGFDPDDFFRRWRALFADYDGYVDGATRGTLGRIEFGEGPATSGANSHDLAGAARIAPLVLALRDDLPALVEAARAQTRMTHNNPKVVDAAGFFARAAHAALHGAAPTDALARAAEADYAAAPVAQWVDAGLALADTDSVTAIATLGQSCAIEGAFPGVVQLIARHGAEPAAALEHNVLAGGDSAARGLLVGLVLGCAAGPGALPEAWIQGLTRARAIRELTAAIP
jgi:ADP-ribosylglycohydrolase